MTPILSLFFLTFAFISPFSYAYFPLGSCNTIACSGSPYDFFWTSVDNVNGTFCFKLVNNDAQSACASQFRNSLNKFVIKSTPLCMDAFIEVTINGAKKGGGVFFQVFGTNSSEAELRVTSMNYNNNSVAALTFCVEAAPPCNTLEAFCGGLPCVYSVYNPFTHTCCPVCNFQIEGEHIPNAPPSPTVHSPPPPLPTVHSPSPPLPMVHSPPPPLPAVHSPSPPPPTVHSPPPTSPPPRPTVIITSPPPPLPLPSHLNCSCSCTQV